MKMIKTTELPYGLMRARINNPDNVSVENLYRRRELEDAVEKAELNVTERMALNKKFYPNGGGFNLFPENVQIHKFNIFHQRGAMPESDTFTKEIEQLEIPEHVCRVKKKTFFSAKDNFTANLDNAIKKLRKVWDK